LGVVTSALYIYVFFVSKFYADMGLQVYYLLISFYGWYLWVRGAGPREASALPVSRLTYPLGVLLAGVSVVIFVFLAWLLKEFTDSPLPWWDAFTTALSVVATWMLARKILEQWLVWIVVNAVSLGLYIYKGLYPTSILFFFYTTMAVVGYLQWRKSYLQDSRVV
jgi:nicotinamide mononucleotide transporter